MTETRMLLIALDGMTWPGLGAAMAAGQAPALSALAARGATGPLATPPHLAGAPFWATVASGHWPEAHGIVGEDEAWAGGLRPAGRASWARPPIWARLEAAGVACRTVNWPGSAPGEAWAGCHVDPRHAVATGATWEEWPLPLGCVPDAWRAALREARVHPADIDGAMLAPLVSDLARIDQARDGTLASIATEMAHAATVQAAATLAAGADWRLCLIRHPWLGTIRAGFDGAPPPYDGVVAGAWRFADGLVARLAAIVGDDVVVLVAGSGAAGQAGALIAAGPGIAPGTAIDVARLSDLAPTMLAALGWRDPALPGRPIAAIAGGAATALPPLDWAPPTVDAALLGEALAAGYAPPPPPPPTWQAARLCTLAQQLLPRDPAEAARVADAALAILPDHGAALGLKAFALVALNRPDELIGIADRLEALAPGRPWAAIARGAYHALRGEAAAARPWLDRATASDEAVTRLRAAAAWLVLRRPDEAHRAFVAAQALAPHDPDAGIGVALAARALRRWREAEEALRGVLAFDPAHAAAWNELALLLGETGRAAEARRAEATARRLGWA